MGAFLAPLLAGKAASTFGWRWGVWAPGAVGLVVAGIVAGVVKDSPEALGRASAEVAWGEEEGGEAADAAAAADDDAADDEAEGVARAEPSEMLRRLRENVLSNPRIWVLAFSFLGVYLLRQGLTSWMVFYLVEAKGVADYADAAARVSVLELGGLVGSLLAGRLSDGLIRRAKPGEGHVGKRLVVVRGYLLGTALALGALWACPPAWVAHWGPAWIAQWAAVFMLGFFLYGPQACHPFHRPPPHA